MYLGFYFSYMRNLMIIGGVFLIILALFYLLRLSYYLYQSFEFTEYGYGILSGKLLILASGVLLVYFGIKAKKKEGSR